MVVKMLHFLTTAFKHEFCILNLLAYTTEDHRHRITTCIRITRVYDFCVASQEIHRKLKSQWSPL